MARASEVAVFTATPTTPQLPIWIDSTTHDDSRYHPAIMPPVNQAQHFGDIRIEGQGQLTINQVVQISVAEVKTRAFVPGSPYVGLHRFEERNKDFFFGRDRLVEQILQLLLQRNFVLVAGPSGSGKSSVVRAGLIPLVASQFAQGCFRALVLTPDRDPFSSLRAALQSAGIAQSRLTELDARTSDAVKSVLTETRPPDERWVLVVDQFEEIFTLCADAKHRESFISGLTQLAQAAQSEIKIVAAMRADFFDRFGPYPTFGALAQQGLQLVLDMEASELRAAIEQPAAKHAVVFEEGLVEQIIADVKGRPGALPLLQYTLDLLWRSDNPVDDRTLNITSYHKLGGVEGALRQRADAIYRSSDPQGKTPRSKEEQELMRQLFLRVVDLTSQGTEARVVSRRASLTDFTRADEQQLIRELADEKLLVTSAQRIDANGNTQSTVEIAHEALLSAWPLLKGWIEQAREVIYVRNRISGDAHRWTAVKAERPEQAAEELWSGTRLQQAIELRAHGDFATVLGGLTETETAFLDASVQERERKAQEEQIRQEQLATAKAALRTRTNRFLGLLVLTMAVALVIMIGLFRRAKTQQERAELVTQIEQGGRAKLLALQLGNIEALRVGLRAIGPAVVAERDPPPQVVDGLTSAAQASGYQLSTPWRHNKEVNEARFSPDGRLAVTASFDGTARVWDVLAGTPLSALKGHSKWVTSASFSPNGNLVVTASNDGTARVWDSHTGAELRILQGHDSEVLSASFSPDGSSIVTAGNDGTARLWNSNTGSVLRILRGHSASVLTATFSSDGNRVVTASDDGTARLWDTIIGNELGILRGHSSAVLAADFSPDGRIVVTASQDGTGRLWDAKTGAKLKVLTGHTSLVRRASFSPDGTLVVSASDDGTARIWDAKTGVELRALKGHSHLVSAAKFSPDGSTVLTASFDDTARLWDAKLGAELLILKGHSSWVKSASFSSDGSRIVTASFDGTARLWSASIGAALFTLKGHSNRVFEVGFSPNGSHVVSSSDDGTARLWDARTGTELFRMKGHSKAVRAACLSPDGSYIVSASDDGTARLWDAKTNTELRLVKNGTRALLAARFSPDGSSIVLGSDDGSAYLLGVKNGTELHTLKGHSSSVQSVNFSPDGNAVVTASDDGTARLWNAKTGSELFVFRGHSDWVRAASFSSDGRRIITASFDGTARLWDVKTGVEQLSLKGHSDRVRAASISSDGRRIVTASEDGTARIWDAQTGLQLMTFAPLRGAMLSAAFSPDNSQIVTAGAEGVVYVYSTKLEFYVERACTLLRGHREQFQDVAEVCKKVGVMPLPPLLPEPVSGVAKQ